VIDRRIREPSCAISASVKILSQPFPLRNPARLEPLETSRLAVDFHVSTGDFFAHDF
jgi:hypothetical protein